MTGDSDSGFGFTWGQTGDIVWLSNGVGEYKRIDRSFLETLRDVARDPDSRSTLPEEANEAIDELFEEDYLVKGASVTQAPTPDEIQLAPRVGLFVAIFLSLCLIVGTRFSAAVTFPTEFSTRIWMLSFLLAASVAHECGHYVVARRYMDPSIRLGLLNNVFPAIFTTTNGAWRCPRSVRIWIPLAGPFVEASIALATGIIHLSIFPESGLFATLLLLMLARILFVLNPLVNGDGYWILVDSLGIVNLRSRGLTHLRAGKLTPQAAYVSASAVFTVLSVGMVAYIIVQRIGLVPIG